MQYNTILQPMFMSCPMFAKIFSYLDEITADVQLYFDVSANRRKKEKKRNYFPRY